MIGQQPAMYAGGFHHPWTWLTEQAGKQGHQCDADEGHTAAGHALLNALAIGSRVLIALASHQVNLSPDAKTGTQCHNKGLKYIDCAVKKCHMVFLLDFSLVLGIVFADVPSPACFWTRFFLHNRIGFVLTGGFGQNKKALRSRASNKMSITSRQVICVYDLVLVIGFQLQPVIEERLNIKGVLLIRPGSQLVVGMLGQVILVR